MAQVKERGGLVLVSFLPRSKPKVPFQELFLLRNQTETLATPASPHHTNVCKISRLCGSNIFARFGATVYWKFSYTTVGKKTVTDGARFMILTFSCGASSKLSWKIRPFSSCFTNSCKLKEKEKKTAMSKVER